MTKNEARKIFDDITVVSKPADGDTVDDDQQDKLRRVSSSTTYSTDDPLDEPPPPSRKTSLVEIDGPDDRSTRLAGQA